MKQTTKLFIFSYIFIAFSMGIVTMLSGCNKQQESTVIQPLSATSHEVKDSEVTQNVKAVLLLDEKVKGLDVAVATLKGDVKLTGIAESQSQIDYVHQIVRSIQGVHTIHDELSVKQ
jgi:hyperosmotically inducible periplasmic protein